MKHKLLYLSLTVVCCMAIVTVICYNYYMPPKIQQPYQIARHQDDTLRIAYIGDSWAALHKTYDKRMSKMAEECLRRPVKVQSFGIGGLTSKEIYEYLFEDQKMKTFMLQGFDYCFISAGINDTYKKMSIDYYKTSIKGIITFMQANNIHPILLEIPDYDIEKAYNHQKAARKIIRRLSMQITGSPLDCKQFFRTALDELSCNNLSIIRYKDWNGKYADDLRMLYMGDGMHLNSKGYGMLDSVIVTVLPPHPASP